MSIGWYAAGPAHVTMAVPTHCSLPMVLTGQLSCRTIQSDSQTTTATIIHRILENRTSYEARNAKKGKSEAEYYASKKQYIAET